MTPADILLSLLGSAEEAQTALAAVGDGPFVRAHVHGATDEIVAAALAMGGHKRRFQSDDGLEEWDSVELVRGRAVLDVYGKHRKAEGRTWQERAEAAEKRLAELEVAS